jgi:signal transduction histidine kinase
MTAGRLRIEPQPSDLRTVIDNAVDVVRLAAEAKRIVLDVVADSPAAIVSGDEARLQQVVWNLLSNAVKSTPERSGRRAVGDDRPQGAHDCKRHRGRY